MKFVVRVSRIISIGIIVVIVMAQVAIQFVSPDSYILPGDSKAYNAEYKLFFRSQGDRHYVPQPMWNDILIDGAEVLILNKINSGIIINAAFDVRPGEITFTEANYAGSGSSVRPPSTTRSTPMPRSSRVEVTVQGIIFSVTATVEIQNDAESGEYELILKVPGLASLESLIAGAGEIVSVERVTDRRARRISGDVFETTIGRVDVRSDILSYALKVYPHISPGLMAVAAILVLFVVIDAVFVVRPINNSNLQVYENFEQVNPGIRVGKKDSEPLKCARIWPNEFFKPIGLYFVGTAFLFLCYLLFSPFQEFVNSVLDTYRPTNSVVDTVSGRVFGFTIGELVGGFIILAIALGLGFILTESMRFLVSLIQLPIMKHKGVWIKASVTEMRQYFVENLKNNGRNAEFYEVIELTYVITEPYKGRQLKRKLTIQTKFFTLPNRNQIHGLAYYDPTRPWIAVLYVNRWLYAMI